MNTLHDDIGSAVESYEVRVRVAAKCDAEAEAKKVGHEVQTLYNDGPADGGAWMNTLEVIGIESTPVDRDVFDPVVAHHEVTADGEAAETVAGKRGEEAADGEAAGGVAAGGVAARRRYTTSRTHALATKAIDRTSSSATPRVVRTARGVAHGRPHQGPLRSPRHRVSRTVRSPLGAFAELRHRRRPRRAA